VAASNGGQLFDAGALGEADEAEVRLVDSKQHCGLGADGILVVGGARAVGRSDLDELRAGPGQHVRDAEPVADLDQFAARDDYLAALGERGEGEQDGRGVVVDDERRLGACQALQRRGSVILSRASPSGGQVELEIGVAAPGRASPLERRLGERRAPEVRVDDDAGRVQHAPEARPSSTLDVGGGPSGQVAGIDPGSNLAARAGEDGSRRLGRGLAPGSSEPLVPEQLVDGREVAQLHDYCASAFTGSAGAAAHFSS
jgi:hypothetical protein